MDPVSVGLAGLNVVSGLLGASSAAKARRAAEAARRQALSDFMVESDRRLTELRTQNARALWSATGKGGDALQALGARLGSAMAASGVYNSSATAGALTRAQDNLSASLIDLATRNANAEAEHEARARQYALGQQLDWGTQSLMQAMQSQSEARTGIGNSLLTLGAALGKPNKPSTPAAGLATTPAAGGVQSPIQALQYSLRNQMGVPDGRSFGAYLNGLQGAKVLGVRPFNITLGGVQYANAR